MTLFVDHYPVTSDFKAHLNPGKMNELGISNGDVVKLSTRSNYSFYLAVESSAAVQSDRIRISRPMRINCGVYLGDLVKLARSRNPPFAESVTFAPISDTVEGLPDQIANLLTAKINFKGITVQKGHVFPVFVFNRVIEFKAVSVAPCDISLVRDPRVITCQAPVPRGDSPSFSDTCYDDVGGIRMGLLRQAIETKESSSFLICGPTGSGKTHLANAIRNETNSYYLYVKCMQLLGMDDNQVIERVNGLSETIVSSAPSVVYFDDFDYVANDLINEDGSTDNRVAKCFLNLINRLKKAEHVVLILSMKDDIPRQFKTQACRIDLGNPTYDQRLSIVKAITRKMNVPNESVLCEIAKSGAKTGSELLSVIEQSFYRVLLDIRDCESITPEQLMMFTVQNSPFQIDGELRSSGDLLDFTPEIEQPEPVEEPEDEQSEEEEKPRRRHRRHEDHERRRRRRHHESRRHSRRHHESESSSEEDDRRHSKRRRDESDEEEAPPKRSSRSRRNRKSDSSDPDENLTQKRRKVIDSDSESEEEKPKKKGIIKSLFSKKPDDNRTHKSRDVFENDTSDEDLQPKTKRSSIFGSKKRSTFEETNDSSDSDPPPKKPEITKPKPKSESSEYSEDESSSDDDHHSSLYGRRKQQSRKAFVNPFGNSKAAGKFPTRKQETKAPSKKRAPSSSDDSDSY